MVIARHGLVMTARAGHSEHVNAQQHAWIIEVMVGRDGKRYPVGGDLPPDQRRRARWMIHNLHCRDGLSIRAAQQVMLEQHGLRRSIGILARDLRDYQCPACAEPETLPR